MKPSASCCARQRSSALSSPVRAVATADADAGARELAAVCHELWRRQLQRFERGGAVPALATIGGGHGGLRLG